MSALPDHIIEQLEKLDEKLIRISRKVNSCIEKNKSRSLYIRYRNEQLAINNEIAKIISEALEYQDGLYHDIAKMNYDLLIRDDIKFRTSQKTLVLTGNFTFSMSGKIHKNGYVYCRNTGINFNPTKFDSNTYVSVYTGKFDCLGNLSIRAGKTSHDICSLPVSFKGTISEHGKTTIKTMEREKEYHPNGRMVIEKIIGAPFANRASDLNTFMENKRKLIQLINEYKYDNDYYIID